MGDTSIEVPLSDVDVVKELPKIGSGESENNDDRSSQNDSEYDSAGSYSDGEDGKVRPRTSDQDSQFEDENIALERESGDGQESIPSRKVDDDEDKKNPQYIPKRGTFYEHDDRTADDIENTDVAENEKNEKDGKKKVWQDKKEKWTHDRFNDTEQAPKSRAELVQIYGYDIRNEEGPPRARRRRRYGRGPNKYTRKWEDEDAYNRPPQTRLKKPPIRKNDGEEYPPLEGRKPSEEGRRENRNTNWPKPPAEREEKPQISNKEPNSKQTQEQSPREAHYRSGASGPVSRAPPSNIQNDKPTNASPQDQNQNNRQQAARVGSGRVVKPQKEIKDSDYRGFTTKTRQYRNIKTEQRILPKNQNKEDQIQSQNFTNRNANVQELEKDMGQMNIHDGNYKGNNKHNVNNRQGSVPPRLQTEQKGSKRYSSIRQRSLPETANPPFAQHSNYYPNDYAQGQPSQPQPQAIIQSPAVPPGVPQILPAPIQIGPQQVPVTATPILQAPPQYGGPPPFTQQQFLQPGVPPTTFIPQQTPQIINYVQQQPQYPQGFQGYQQQFTPIVSQSLNIMETPPTELYQPQGGITYYSADQQIAQRSLPQKRPKAAIPIVAPPSQPANESKPTREENQGEQDVVYGVNLTEAEQPPSGYIIEETIQSNSTEESNPNAEQ